MLLAWLASMGIVTSQEESRLTLRSFAPDMVAQEQPGVSEDWAYLCIHARGGHHGVCGSTARSMVLQCRRHTSTSVWLVWLVLAAVALLFLVARCLLLCSFGRHCCLFSTHASAPAFGRRCDSLAWPGKHSLNTIARISLLPALTNQDQQRLSVSPAQLGQALVHVSLEVPVWLLGCNVCQVLEAVRQAVSTCSLASIGPAIHAPALPSS